MPRKHLMLHHPRSDATVARDKPVLPQTIVETRFSLKKMTIAPSSGNAQNSPSQVFLYPALTMGGR